MNTFLTSHLRGFCVPLVLVLAVVFGQSPARAQGDDGSEDAVALFNAAQDRHEHGDLAGAIILYDKALKAVPEFPEAEYQRGVAELQLGTRDEAERSFRRALQLREDWSPALTALGSLLVDSERYAEAQTLLAKALEADPQSSPALAAMVDLRLKTKASPAVLQGLLDTVTGLTAKAKPTPSLWAARAALESALDKHDAARASVTNALALEPANRTALFLAADLAIRDGDMLGAEEAANALEKQNADKAALARLRSAIAAANAPDTAGAAELEKKLEADPKNAAALGGLCWVLRRDSPLRAIDYCRRAAEAEPSNLRYVIGYAAALVQAKQFDTATAVLRKVIAAAPDNSTAHANLAAALFEQKRYAEAREQYEWLTLKQPDLAAAYYFLAICYDRLGKELDAMANYQQYLRRADPAANKPDIEKVNLRLSQMRKKAK
jgi:tetratricopeptide (TPR) repeat protein